MKAVTVKQLKDELKHCNSSDLIDICIRLSKFKKENKELLSYLLFEPNELDYIHSVKKEIDIQFKKVNKKSYYFINKSARKILSQVKKFIRYSQNKETEIELLLYFCFKIKGFQPSIKNNTRLINLYFRQLDYIKRKIALLHEDLQFDFNEQLKNY